MGTNRTVVVTGAGGLIGGALVRSLREDGWTVRTLVRRKPEDGERDFFWQPREEILDVRAFDGADAVVNLAGRSLATRWTRKVQQEIYDSRIKGTTLVAKALAKRSPRPAVLVNASAVGYYGDRGDEELDERSEPGQGFLAGLCQDWEQATDPARQAGVRVVTLRIGPVLAAEGGALAKMLPAFRLGLGGTLGNGRQYFSWIDAGDMNAVIRHALDTERCRGPVNAVAPQPVTNARFTRTLGRVLRRPTFLPVPAFAVKLMFGQMGREVLLSGARVVPRALADAGFAFRYPDVETSLRHQLRGEGV